LQRHPARIEPSVLVPFVDQIFDLESVKPDSFAQFQNVSDGLRGGLGRGTKMVLAEFFLREGFQGPFDDLFGLTMRTARELLLQQLLAVRRKANGIHKYSIREASDSAQRVWKRYRRVSSVG